MNSSVTLPPAINNRQPWLGLESYSEADSELFFGRDKEALELVRLVHREVLAVLFGPSGAGKTSLLNAGLFPRLRASGFLPIPIRLDHSGEQLNYIGQIKELVAGTIRGHKLEEEALASPQVAPDQETLWEYLHRVVFWDWRNNPVTPVLVFDQFEEIFTLGRNLAASEEFLTELADLVENYIPAKVRSRMEARGEAIPFASDEPKYKVVLSLREDFVWRLDSLRKAMPSVMHNRYTVTRMNGEQALLAVREPGKGIVDEPVAHQIVHFVAAANESRGGEDGSSVSLANLPVEPALLSVVCRELNARRIERERDRITEDLLEESHAGILNDFYERAFVGLDPAVRVFVEDRLLTVGGFRGTAPLEDATRAGIAEDGIHALVDRRLIRSEERLGIPHLELTHDLLTRVVRRSRAERQEREEKEREKREREIEERERDKQEENHKEELRRTRRLLAIVTAAGVICLLLGLLAFSSYRTAQAREKESKARELAAYGVESLNEDPERSVLLGMSAVDATRRFNQPVVPAAVDALQRGILLSQVQLTLRGHSEAVNSAAFSPDGKRLATASDDQTAKIWDASTGKELLTLSGHSGHVSSVAFSPDGKLVTTGSWDATTRLWDAARGNVLRTFSVRSTVLSVAFSSDGNRLATASKDKTTKVWDVGSGKELLTLRGHTSEVDSVAFSPDGKRLATASRDKTAKVWNSSSGKELLTLRGHKESVVSVAFSPDGKRLSTSGGDNTAKVWDADSGNELLTLRGHSDFVKSVAFSPDSRRIVTASSDKTTRVWTASSDVVLRGHSETVDAVAFSPDGTRLATSSDDKTAKVWDASSGQELLTLGGHSGWVEGVAFSPNGRRLATASEDKTAKVWDASNGDELLTLRHLETVYCVAFSPDGKRIATASADKTAKVWDASSGKELLTLSGHSGTVDAIAFSPDGKRLATGSWDKTTKVWDAASGRELLTLGGHSDSVLAVAFSPDGKRLASASRDSTMKLWAVNTGKQLLVLRGHSGPINSVAFNRDGKRLATAGSDKTAKVWDPVSGEELLTLRGHSEGVTWVDFSPDGKRLATASDDHTVQIYTLVLEDLLALAKQRVTRSLTSEECKRYFQSEACPALP